METRSQLAAKGEGSKSIDLISIMNMIIKQTAATDFSLLGKNSKTSVFCFYGIFHRMVGWGVTPYVS